MSRVTLLLFAGQRADQYRLSDTIDTLSTAAEVHRRIHAMIEQFYPAAASMQSNLGNKQVIVRVNDDGHNLHVYDKVWKRMLAAANDKPVI